MKKLSLLIGLTMLSLLGLIGCTYEQKPFDYAIQPGLFQGHSENNPDWEIHIEFYEIVMMQYVKTTNYKLKDLSTLDKHTPDTYHVKLLFSKGNENASIVFTDVYAANSVTTDTYKIRTILYTGLPELSDLDDVTFKLIDNNGDKVTDELELHFFLNGKQDSAKLTLVAKTEGHASYGSNFEYECTLSCDEKITFTTQSENKFYAGSKLFYSFAELTGYKIEMYVNGEFYSEATAGSYQLQCSYVTGYRDVNIEFKAVAVNE